VWYGLLALYDASIAPTTTAAAAPQSSEPSLHLFIINVFSAKCHY